MAPDRESQIKDLQAKIDEIHLNRQFLGIRRMTDAFHDEGNRVNHNRVGRLVRKIGIEAIYPKPNLSKANPAHWIYQYLIQRGCLFRQP